MPIIKSAIKKMRQDQERTLVNRAKKDALKKVIKLAETKPNSESISKAFSALDRAAKIGLIPKGRADRKKSRLPKIETGSVKTKTSPKTSKSKKTSSK